MYFVISARIIEDKRLDFTSDKAIRSSAGITYVTEIGFSSKLSLDVYRKGNLIYIFLSCSANRQHIYEEIDLAILKRD